MKNILKIPYKCLKKVKHSMAEIYRDADAVKKLTKTKEDFQKNKKDEINVVFIAQYIPAWNKHVWIYNVIMKRKNMNAHILCVPSDIEKNQFVGDSSKNDVYEYFVSHGYENCINAYENGRWFDLKSLSPDYVFHSRPYNHFMPVEYTSINVCQYAKLCNFLYGASMSKMTMNTVFNKSYFRHCSFYFAIDEAEKEYWEKRFEKGCKAGLQKSVAVGSPAFQSILSVKKEKYDNKKTIIWTPRWSTDKVIGGSNFFNYKDVLPELLGGKQETELIMRPHPLMFGNFVKQGLMTEKEVDDYKSMCASKGNIRFDTEKEYTDTFWKTDFMVTDISGIIIEYFITGKPIIFCTSEVEHHENLTEAYQKILEGCYIARNKDELEECINNLLNGKDTLLEKRKEIIEQFIDRKMTSSEKIVNVLEEDYRK